MPLSKKRVLKEHHPDYYKSEKYLKRNPPVKENPVDYHPLFYYSRGLFKNIFGGKK